MLRPSGAGCSEPWIGSPNHGVASSFSTVFQRVRCGKVSSIAYVVTFCFNCTWIGWRLWNTGGGLRRLAIDPVAEKNSRMRRLASCDLVDSTYRCPSSRLPPWVGEPYYVLLEMSGWATSAWYVLSARMETGAMDTHTVLL
jgi:hypothetical protein